MLAEVVVAVNRLPAEVAHEGAAATRHPVTALRLHQTCGTLVALPDTGSGHLFLTGHETNDIWVQFTDYVHFYKGYNANLRRSNSCFSRSLHGLWNYVFDIKDKYFLDADSTLKTAL